MNAEEIVVWCVIGLLAGSVAGLVMSRKKEGFGWATNLLFGLVGAFVGTALFALLKLDFGLAKLTIDLDDVVASTFGAFIVVFAAKFLEGRRQKDG